MIIKSKIKHLVSLLSFLLLLNSASVVYAQKFNEGSYGAGDYSGLAEDETDSCSKSNPNGDITIKGLYPGDTHLKAKFTGMADPYNKFEIKWGVSPYLAKYYLGDEIFGDKDTRTYLIENLQPDTVYYVKIRAVNGCNKGRWSETLSERTLPLATASKTTGYLAINKVEVTPRVESTPSVNKPTQPSSPLTYDLNLLVTDKDGNPLQGANVVIPGLNLSQQTDVLGKATFRDLDGGQYEVNITKGNLSGNTVVDLKDPKIKSYDISIKLAQNETLQLSKSLMFGILGIVLLILAVILFKRMRKPKTQIFTVNPQQR